jgi:hypothetical protein
LVSDVKERTYTERVETQKRVLRRMFEPKRNKMVGGKRKLHIEELHNLHTSPSKIRMIKQRRKK